MTSSAPIEKGLPGAELLAHVAVSKYSDHLPLNRMEGILSRHGVDNGGYTAAAMYAVISSAKRHGLDPWRYLRDTFARLPDMTVSQLPDLLPDNWQDSHAK